MGKLTEDILRQKWLHSTYDELKELKDRLSKINSLLDKLDERLVQGELARLNIRSWQRNTEPRLVV